MNYAPIFTFAARLENGYNAAQDWIANDAPVLEKRLKQSALKTVIAVLEFALMAVDYIQSAAPIWVVRSQLAKVNAHRWLVQQAIKVCRFNERRQITATASALWNRKGQLATAVMDRVFCLTA